MAERSDSTSDGGRIAMDSATVARLVAEDPLWERALAIHYDAIVVDGHLDTPWWILDDGYDPNVRHDPLPTKHQVDFPRMTEAGLDAAFFAVYVARSYGEGEAATERALALIEATVEAVGRSAGRAEIARTADDIERIARAGRHAVVLALEGGHALQSSPEVLRGLADEGMRYVTLTHISSHGWADSSQDEPRHGGLSEAGRELIREMNRLGVLVDVSHASDEVLRDVVEITAAPIIASHSSARALVPLDRNLSDDGIRAIAGTGGVVMVNFYGRVVNPRLTPEVIAAAGRRAGGDMRQIFPALGEEESARGIPPPTLEDVLDHIEHVARVAGPDHVGLGSDFDGATQLPAGLEDVTRLPWITYGLLKRGFSEEDVRKMLGGNVLRVMREAEEVSD
jgi:membrane dipeptidase